MELFISQPHAQRSRQPIVDGIGHRTVACATGAIDIHNAVHDRTTTHTRQSTELLDRIGQPTGMRNAVDPMEVWCASAETASPIDDLTLRMGSSSALEKVEFRTKGISVGSSGTRPGAASELSWIYASVTDVAMNVQGTITGQV